MALVSGSPLLDKSSYLPTRYLLVNSLPAPESHKIFKTVARPVFIAEMPKKPVTFGESAGSVQSMNSSGAFSPQTGLQFAFL